jgi:hypothetical protein
VDAIFAGTVRAIVSTETAGTAGPTVETVVHFDIERPFLNARAGSVEIVDVGFSSNTYRFTKGHKYIVYAWKGEDGRFTTSQCSRTGPLSEAAEDLKFLTSLPQSGTGGRVYGRVNEWVQHPAEEHGVDYGPLENIVVNVQSATFSHDARTDRDGRYDVAGIPLGAARISIVKPAGFHADGERNVEVKDLRGCVAADFRLIAKGAAHGLVMDTAGRPMAGVSVEAVAEELAGYQPKAIHSPAQTDSQGRFSFDWLPPGAYVFGINITKEQHRQPSGPATFLPGTAVAREATVIHLEPGDDKDVGTIRVP